MDIDYIVVGAGSAGCVVASRLSETGDQIVLLEAGPPDNLPWIHIPAGVLKLLSNPKVNWCYGSEGSEGTAGRRIQWPRGKTLGGSSSINGMLHIRGNPADFNQWAQLGCTGWKFQDVLPYFRKSENYLQGGERDFRGQDGPLNVQDYRTILPVTHQFVKAAQEAGFVYTNDLNGSKPEAVGYSQQNRKGRRRASGAQTYLKQSRKRTNLRIETEALASRLLFEGKRCVGVTFTQGGQEKTIRARKEVILCGGVVNSPQLLQISGVGPAQHLQSIGVPVLHDLPGVGSNLQDHYVARIAHRVKGVVTINQLSRGVRLAAEVLRYAFTGRGALTFGVTSAQVFCRSNPDKPSPDLQLLFTPGSYNYDPSKYGALEVEPGVTVAVCPVQPSSRGTILARSADPTMHPTIAPNYFSHPNDARVLLSGIRLARQILSAPTMAAISVIETQPGPDLQSDEDLIAYTKKFGTSYMHGVGTCRMGIDETCVVDERLRVRGLSGLRVVDASIMPTLTTGNTNATTVMIGEKGAAMILEDRKAP